MSLHAIYWAYAQINSGLTLKQGPRLALLLLALEANGYGIARVRIEHLAERMGGSERSAQRATHALQRAQLIDIEERHEPDGTQLPNDYHLLMGSRICSTS